MKSSIQAYDENGRSPHAMRYEYSASNSRTSNDPIRIACSVRASDPLEARRLAVGKISTWVRDISQFDIIRTS